LEKVNSSKWTSPTLVLSTASVVASIFSVYSMSNGDLNTTLLILQEVQPLKLLTGILATSFPIFIIYFIIGLLKLNQTHSNSIGRLIIVLPSIFFLSLIALISFSPKTFLFLLLVIFVLSELFVYSLLGLLWRKWKKNKVLLWRNEFIHSHGKDFWYSLPSIALILLAGNWLPVEQLEIENQNISGYVISEEYNRFIILEEKSRKIVFIKTSDLISRTLCEKKKSPIVNLLNSTDGKYPTCT
jgi:hypothetical protein